MRYGKHISERATCHVISKQPVLTEIRCNENHALQYSALYLKFSDVTYACQI